MRTEIRRAVEADASAIGALYSRAFANDPVTSWVTPDPPRRERVLRRLNSEIARYSIGTHGEVYVAESAGALVGAAIWQPPLPHPFSWRAVPFGLRSGAALGRDIPRMIRMGRAVSNARPAHPHWYLQLLGVEPTAQHTGVGSALVREQLKRLDAEGLPAYLETTKENLVFYGTLGFAVTGEIPIHPTAPSEFSLLRPPSAPEKTGA